MNKTKKVIYESAISIFSIYGYDGAKMDDIAKNAKVSKGTLYYHFKSKEELFDFMVKEGMTQMKEYVSDCVNRENNSILKLRILCKAQLKLLFKNKDFFQVILGHLWGNQVRNFEIRETLKNYMAYIEDIFKEASNKGDIKRSDTKFMAYSFFGMMCSAAGYELIDCDEKDLNVVIDKFMTNLLNGIE